jgi:photosystem II stability/assembly factor-like uncharacterized protein
MPSLYVATNGLSVWRSTDLGETLERMPSGTGLYSGSRVWSLLSTPKGLLAGTDSGIYRWAPANNQWMPLPSPTDCQMITALACAPDNPDVLLAGAQPGALYRSEDNGQSWNKLDVSIAPHVSSGFGENAAFARGDRPLARHWTRVTQIVFDPHDAKAVWAGVEIDGAWRSRDGGRRWERSSTGLKTQDVHGFAVVRGDASPDGKRMVYATTNKGTYLSHDDGGTWQQQEFASPWQYTRSIAARADDGRILFMTNGSGAPGTAGKLFRSDDTGGNWRDANLPGTVESSLYFLATNLADPNLIFAATALGQLYRSTDGGERWTALRQRLGEVRALAWLPD